jgi:hypothetical protein
VLINIGVVAGQLEAAGCAAEFAPANGLTQGVQAVFHFFNLAFCKKVVDIGGIVTFENHFYFS